MSLELIDKQDGFQIVESAIASILVAEIANQQTLAIAAGKDPDLWKIRIFTERSNAWEQWLNDQSDQSPICNIWFDTTTYDKGTSNVVERQRSDTVYNIDCYGFGLSADTPGGGHVAGDAEAAYNYHRSVKLIRNILMAAENTYLGLRGTVWGRWIQSIRTFQPEYDSQSAQQVVAGRIAFAVSFNEFSPQVATEILEHISVTTFRTEDGEVHFRADYIDGTPVIDRKTQLPVLDKSTDGQVIEKEN
jgi:hypothetical protein